MKKLIITAIVTLALSVSAMAQAKYVFYFIGDGMGTSSIQLTEMFRAASKGELGVENLSFSDFPVATMSTHYSANSDVTDSAASGTALATGHKTNNSYIGMGPDGEKFTNIAEMAKANGKKVAIVTTVTANHATPASFTAHQRSRNMYYEISLDMIENGFEFYGGSGLSNETKMYDGSAADPIRPKFENAGYMICNPTEFNANYKNAEKILMLPGKGQTVGYAIDAKNDDPENRVTLKQMVESAITFLMKDNSKKGFFMMAEGGDIDHGTHSHDAASTIQEIIAFDEAVQVAIDFYKKYPKQTLIVVTSDHDTGGVTLAPDKASTLARIGIQKHSFNVISDMLKQRMVKEKKILSWEETKEFLKEQFGLWGELKVSWEEEKALRDIYEQTIAVRDAGSEKDLYADNAKIVAAAGALLNTKAKVYWSTSHSACYTPVYAMGVGAELFSHKTDNTEIPMLIKKAAAYK